MPKLSYKLSYKRAEKVCSYLNREHNGLRELLVHILPDIDDVL